MEDRFDVELVDPARESERSVQIRQQLPAIPYRHFGCQSEKRKLKLPADEIYILINNSSLYNEANYKT